MVRQPVPSSSSDDTNKKRVHRKKRVHDLLGDGNKRRKKNNRWSTEEDDRLRHCVMYHGIDSNKWTKISADIPGRNNKQCQERWCNHLDESVNKGPITGGERQILAAIYEENNEFPKTMSFVNLLPGRYINVDLVHTRQHTCMDDSLIHSVSHLFSCLFF